MLTATSLKGEISKLKSKLNSQQKTIKKQEQDLSKLRSQLAEYNMASTFAHEITQPLTAIIAYSQSCMFLIKNSYKYKIICDKLLPSLERISRQAMHAGEIIHSMKNFMREADDYFEETEINELIDNALSVLNHELLDFKLKITLNLSDGLPKIMTKKIHIIQIILNLAQNSIEALQNELNIEPEIMIKTRLLDDKIRVDVIDNGPGIPPELMNKILHSNFTTKPHGTGIGLTVCQTLVKLHGGTLHVHQQKAGAWFSFTLPINRTSHDIKA